MRSEVKIVWVEDDQDRGHERRKKDVTNKIKLKGYKPDIKEFRTIDTAIEYINTPCNRVDFFISDYDLGVSDNSMVKTGLDYLVNLRESAQYKQFFILYSKNEESFIQEQVIKKMNNNGIAILNNFMFISIHSSATIPSIKNNFEKAIDISLSKWDELNALRGEYMLENAELEQKLKVYLNIEEQDICEYGQMINKFFDVLKKNYYRDFDQSLNKKWLKMKDTRNALAHVVEMNDGEGHYIESFNNKVRINEKDIDRERNQLLEWKDEIDIYLEKVGNNVKFKTGESTNRNKKNRD